jgi:hypothetical protein
MGCSYLPNKDKQRAGEWLIAISLSLLFKLNNSSTGSKG